MTLFVSLHAFSKTRLSWLILFGFIVFFIGCAYTFQHVMNLDPCVMCIYERVAMIGIGVSALLGASNPTFLPIRWLGIVTWAATSYKGLTLAMEHVEYQTNIFATCSPLTFPEWAPLNKWLPNFFEATGDCSEVVWQFMTLSMPAWLVVIYASSLVCACLVGVSQFFKTK